MSQCARLGLVAALWTAAVSVAGTAVAFAAEADKDKPPPATDKSWKKLFDGRTLKGWKSCDFFEPGRVYAQDGELVMELGKPMTGAVYTGGDFPKTDYEVVLEGKKIEGEDFFCTTTFPVGDSFCSFVVGGWGGQTIGLSSINGADASENETSGSKEFKTGKWYRIRIRVTSARIETWIDDEKTVDVAVGNRKISTRIECRVCQPFGVATYATVGAVRDIRVRSLTDAEKKAIAARKAE
jgi:hypothetical protein